MSKFSEENSYRRGIEVGKEIGESRIPLRIVRMEASHARLVKTLEDQKRWFARMGYNQRVEAVEKALAEAKALTLEAKE